MSPPPEPALFAALRGRDEAAVGRAQAQAGPGALSPEGEPALHFACRLGSAASVRALLLAGADPLSLCRGRLSPALYSPGRLRSAACAALNGFFQSARSDLDEMDCADKMSALIAAGLRPHAPSQGRRSAWSDLLDWPEAPLSLLLPWIQAGASINQTDRQGRALLYKAVDARREPDAWRLLALGADPFILQPGAQNASCAASARGLWRLCAAFGDLARARFESAALRQAAPASAPSPPRPPARL